VPIDALPTRAATNSPGIRRSPGAGANGAFVPSVFWALEFPAGSTVKKMGKAVVHRQAMIRHSLRASNITTTAA